MSIRNAGKFIKWMRLNRGMTQDELSEGVCSVVTLSKIENEQNKVTSKAFDALCNKLGVSETKYPCFKSETEFNISIKLNSVRKYLSIGNYSSAIKELNECIFLDDVGVELRAEYIFLVYIVAKLYEVEDYIISPLIAICADILELNGKKPEIYKSVVEYEIYMYSNMLKNNRDNILGILEYIDEIPLTENECAYVKVLSYACLAYMEKYIDIEVAKKYALKALKCNYEIENYCISFDLFDLIYGDTVFRYMMKDIYEVYGNIEEIDKGLVYKLVDKAVEVSHHAELEAVYEDYTVSKILKKARENVGVRKKYIYQGICTETAYNKYLAGYTNPSVKVFNELMERCGISLESFVVWQTNNEENNGKNGIYFDVFYNTRFSIRELIKLENRGIELAKEGKCKEACDIWERIIGYLKNTPNDISIVAKVFPDVVYRYLCALFEMKEYERIVNFIDSKSYPEYLFDIDLAKRIFEIYINASSELGLERVFARSVVEIIDKLEEMKQEL